MTSYMWNVPEPLDTAEVEVTCGARIILRRHGNSDGPRLVLSHANGLAADLYYPFWRLLASRFDLILYDLRSHGWNPRSGAATSEHRHLRHGPGTRPARGRAPLRREARRRRIPFGVGAGGAPPGIPGAGASRRSFCSIHPCTRRTGMPRRPKPCGGACVPRPGSAGIASRRARSSRRTSAGSGCSSWWRRESRSWRARHCFVPRGTEAADRAGADTNFAARASGKLTRFSTLSAYSLEPELSRLACPVKVIAGDPTFAFSFMPSTELEGIVGFEYDFIPNTTHFLPLEEPAECAATMVEFLEKEGFA